MDLKKMQQDRTEKLVGENRNLAWVMGQDTLKTYEDKIAKNIKKGTPISSANVWKQVGIKKTSQTAVGIRNWVDTDMQRVKKLHPKVPIMRD